VVISKNPLVSAGTLSISLVFLAVLAFFSICGFPSGADRPRAQLRWMPQVKESPWTRREARDSRDAKPIPIDVRNPQAISVCIDRLAGRDLGLYVDPAVIPESAGIPHEWRVAGPGTSTRPIRLAPEARLLAFIGRPALPFLSRALAQEKQSATRIQILLAMMQIPECRPTPELREIAAGDRDFTVRSLAADLLWNIEGAEAAQR